MEGQGGCLCEDVEGNDGGDDEDRLWGVADRPRGEKEESPDRRVAGDRIDEEDGERHQYKKSVKSSQG